MTVRISNIINYLHFTAACGALLAAAIFASPATAASKQSQISVAVVTPLTLVKLDDLDFGRIIPGNSGGRVTIAPDGARTATGSIILIGTGHHAAHFAGRGTTNQRIQIDISNRIDLSGPGPTMRVDRFRFGDDPSLNPIGNSGRARIATANGVFQFPVGARLRVGANQPAGVYSGTFTVTANYQ